MNLRYRHSLHHFVRNLHLLYNFFVPSGLDRNLLYDYFVFVNFLLHGHWPHDLLGNVFDTLFGNTAGDRFLNGVRYHYLLLHWYRFLDLHWYLLRDNLVFIACSCHRYLLLYDFLLNLSRRNGYLLLYDFILNLLSRHRNLLLNVIGLQSSRCHWDLNGLRLWHVTCLRNSDLLVVRLIINGGRGLPLRLIRHPIQSACLIDWLTCRWIDP